MEMTAAANGEECAAPKGSLRWIARKMLERSGEETAAAKEVADRLDGKVPQGVIGGDEDDPAIQTVTKIELIGVRPSNTDT